MKRSITFAAAALAVAMAFSAPAQAQVGNLGGVGGARAANQPSTVGLSSVEGRSRWHRGWRRGWHHNRGWRRHWHRRWHRPWR